jgi:thiamine pyrophosphokinase
MSFKTVIVADGTFPTHVIPLGYIRDADRIICCDGSTRNLLDFGLVPEAIVGDMDSLSADLVLRFGDRLFANDDQETNDLTKAVTWCTGMGYKDLAIVGATGKREDHTIGNISLLAEYGMNANVVMVTDSGIFKTYYKSAQIPAFPGQQVSLFSIDPETEITTYGLKYPLKGSKLNNWWMATLNEALGDNFSIQFSCGRVIIYLKFR